ncbi:MAG: tRNA pseudouridine(55) synthase TruB [Desulfovibrio sp.]|nr:tRNA pseudouridine(55) synthase TruB [Desulfovibrio sp.]
MVNTFSSSSFQAPSQILPQLHGLVVLNKASGPSSNRCLMQIKRLGQKKIGHAGTLDPLASGVLLVLLGQATKLSSYLQSGGGKIYQGTLRLGQITDTWDCLGQVLEERDSTGISPEAISEEIAAWTELREQVVPPYSAAKLDGKPLYKLARKGTMVERVKSVDISQAQILAMDLPFVRFRVHCRSGTYIRSLAHSLGMRLGCGAVLTALTREFSYPFGLEGSCTLDEIEADPAVLLRALRPLREALPAWACLEVPEAWVEAVKNGRHLPCSCFAPEANHRKQAILMYQGQELALASRCEEGKPPYWEVTRGLWSQKLEM